MPKRLIFAESSPVGDRVILTRDRWREIVRFKHPAVAGHEADVRDCVRNPDFIRSSAKDLGTRLYYRRINLIYICVVVAGDDPNARFVVTAYFTRRPKKGQLLWTK